MTDTIEKRINLEGIDLLNFSGVNDENLNLLKHKFDSTIVMRGEMIFVKGKRRRFQVLSVSLMNSYFFRKDRASFHPRMLSLL